MDVPNKDASLTLEYLYKEYVRISDLCNSYTSSRYDDFKFLGAIGGILLAWKPITDLISLHDTRDKSLVLLFGFIAVLFVIAVLAIRDLLKESLTQYYLYKLRFYESEIRASLAHSEPHTFHLATDWEQWNRQKFQPIVLRFNLLFFLAVMIPVFVLAFQPPHWYAAIYLTITLLILAIYLSAVRILPRGTK